MSYYIPLIPGRLYHVFSRATGSEKLFKEEENYRYFLQKMTQHLSPVCFIRAYCLLPNHFHLVVEVKEESQIKAAFLAVKKDKVYNPEIISDFVMERFSNFLNSYTKSFNKRFNRKGSLFMDYLRRVEISSDAHLTAAIFYVHKNPVHHGLVKDIHFWAWSSYQECISENSTQNSRKEVLDWFGGREGFLEFHSQGIKFKGFDEPA